MKNRETAEGNDAQTKLDNIALQIEEAIKEKNYDYALVLVEKLNWTHDLHQPWSEELVKEYEKKVTAIELQSIKLLKRINNGINRCSQV